MTRLIFSCYFSVASARWRHSLNAHFCRHKVEKDDVASFNLRPSFCRKLLIISKQQHQIETATCAWKNENVWALSLLQSWNKQDGIADWFYIIHCKCLHPESIWSGVSSWLMSCNFQWTLWPVTLTVINV